MDKNVPEDGSPTVTVVIPTYNERENLADLAGEILALGDRYCLVIVDDNSPDGTGEVADDLAEDQPGHVQVIHRPGKQGIGSAYLEGFRAALGTDSDVIATMDADFSHRPEDLRRIVESTARADLVLGSRYVEGGATKGWPLYRRLLSRGGGLYSRSILNVPINDLTGGFKAYRRTALETLDLEEIRSDGYVFQIETTYRAFEAGLKVVEIPITFEDRVAGSSKLSRWIVVEAMLTVWRLRLAGQHRK